MFYLRFYVYYGNNLHFFDTFYQTFKCIMARGESKIDYFAQPFDKNPIYHNFRIATDIDLDKPLGVERISDLQTIDDINVIENSNKNIKPIIKNSGVDLIK